MWDLRYARDGWAIDSGQYQQSTGGQNGDLPEWAKDPPSLYRGDDFYLAALWELSSCRSFGAGVMGPIPWSAIVEYARHKKLDEVMSEVFFDVIRSLDETYLSWSIESRKPPKVKRGAAGRSRRG